MTEAEVNAIRARLEAATPGPWSDNLEIDDCGIETEDGYTICHIQWHGSINTMARTGQRFSHDDARFIAHAPTDIKALLEEMGRFRETLKAARIQINGALMYWDTFGKEFWDKFEPHEPEAEMREGFKKVLQRIDAAMGGGK